MFAIFDAALVAENMVLAAEALGFGSLFVGRALPAFMSNPKLMETFKIPFGTLPITLLCIGYPDEDPPTRPRLPMETALFVDTYKDLQLDQIESAVNHMNEQFAEEGYYEKYMKTRRNWIEHVQSKLEAKPKKEETIAEGLKTLGFI